MRSEASATLSGSVHSMTVVAVNGLGRFCASEGLTTAGPSMLKPARRPFRGALRSVFPGGQRFDDRLLLLYLRVHLLKPR